MSSRVGGWVGGGSHRNKSGDKCHQLAAVRNESEHLMEEGSQVVQAP